MRIAIAQLNPTVGDLDGNLARMLSAAEEAESRDADFIVYPSFALTGGPLEGLGASENFTADAQEHLQRFVAECPLLALVPCIAPFEREVEEDEEGETVNASALFIASDDEAEVLAVPALEEESACPVLEIGDVTVACLLDAHLDESVELESVDAFIEMTADLAAEPQAAPAAWSRLSRMRSIATENNAFVANANLVGASDSAVFAGGSACVGPDGALVHASPIDAEDIFIIDTAAPDVADEVAAAADGNELLWGYLVTATGDYLRKNGFTDAVLGLSGGIDSAVVATIAVDALGADHVHGVLMPGPYSSEGSVTDAAQLAQNLGIDTVTIPIDEPMRSFHEVLGEPCGGSVAGIAAENLQARIRAVYLMTLSNAKGWLPLNTGNKSEAAMGFSTLGGDTAGVYAPIGEVYKTDVYALARWRMQRSASIPQACIDKAPSAELYPGATDQDRLPPYEQLDDVLFDHVEDNMGAEQLVAAGHDKELVETVLTSLQRAEFKRRLEPQGPLAQGASLSGDRAWPVTNRWRDASAD